MRWLSLLVCLVFVGCATPPDRVLPVDGFTVILCSPAMIRDQGHKFGIEGDADALWVPQLRLMYLSKYRPYDNAWHELLHAAGYDHDAKGEWIE